MNFSIEKIKRMRKVYLKRLLVLAVVIGGCMAGKPSISGGLFSSKSAFEIFGNGQDGDFIATANITPTATHDGTRKIISFEHIIAVSPDKKTLTTDTSGAPFLNNVHLSVGDEILWHVTAVYSSLGDDNACGIGSNLRKGSWDFARVTAISHTAGAINSVTIDKPIGDGSGAIDNIAVGNALGNDPLCLIQIARIPNFQNLTLDTTSSSRNYFPTPFTISEMSGGILILKVSNTLRFQGNPINQVTMHTNGYGFPGGLGGPISTLAEGGYGDQGRRGNTNGGGGGPANQHGGGGGHGGRGGGASSTGGYAASDVMSYGYCSSGQCRLHEAAIMGGGGGGGGGGSSAGATGGAGGGIIILLAKNIVVDTGLTVNIWSMGSNGVSGGSSGSSGGGAGGSIFVVTKEILNSGSMYLTAMGGNGIVSASGDGGGGVVEGIACISPVNSPTVFVTKGSGGCSGGCNGGLSANGPTPLLIDQSLFDLYGIPKEICK